MTWATVMSLVFATVLSEDPRRPTYPSSRCQRKAQRLTWLSAFLHDTVSRTSVLARFQPSGQEQLLAPESVPHPMIGRCQDGPMW